jgi:hypothetical protein
MVVKKEFSSITLSLPTSQLLVSKGKVESVRTLTQLGNLKTKGGKKAVKIETNNQNKAYVVNEGVNINTKEEKMKKKVSELSKNVVDTAFGNVMKKVKARKTLSEAVKGKNARDEMNKLKTDKLVSDMVKGAITSATTANVKKRGRPVGSKNKVK